MAQKMNSEYRLRMLNEAWGWFVAAGVLAVMSAIAAVTIGWFAPALLAAVAVFFAFVGAFQLVARYPLVWFTLCAIMVVLAGVMAATIGWFAPLLAGALAAVFALVGVVLLVSRRRAHTGNGQTESNAAA